MFKTRVRRANLRQRQSDDEGEAEPTHTNGASASVVALEDRRPPPVRSSDSMAAVISADVEEDAEGEYAKCRTQ